MKKLLMLLALVFTTSMFAQEYYWTTYSFNVDPEDGVLSNRPIYSDGTMLTYPSLSKPVKRETPLNHCFELHISLLRLQRYPCLKASPEWAEALSPAHRLCVYEPICL